jgi:hypothetical protein
MAVISGMYGAVKVNTGIASTITNWTLDNNININSYNASNTRGYSGKIPGIRSCSGSFSGLGGVPPVRPGERFKFIGFTGPANGVLGNTTGSTYQIMALVSNITINWNYGDYSPINWQVQWASDYQQVGDELIPGNTGFQDISLPPVDTMVPAGNCTLVVGSHTGVCLESATLTFATNIQNFGNSCGKGWQSGVAGATTVTLSSKCDAAGFDVFSDDHLPGKNEIVKIYVEGGDGDCSEKAAWEFHKMIIGSLSGLNVDIAGGGVVNFDVNMEFNAFPDGQPGKILYDSNVFWQAADDS